MFSVLILKIYWQSDKKKKIKFIIEMNSILCKIEWVSVKLETQTNSNQWYLRGKKLISVFSVLWLYKFKFNTIFVVIKYFTFFMFEIEPWKSVTENMLWELYDLLKKSVYFFIENRAYILNEKKNVTLIEYT